MSPVMAGGFFTTSAIWEAHVYVLVPQLPIGIKPSLYTIVGEGNGTPLQYSCLENPMDGGAWWATVHGVVKSQT